MTLSNTSPSGQRLESLGATRILFSEWVVPGATGNASAIYCDIAPLTQEKDRLWVQEVLKDAQWDKLLISDQEFSDLLTHARG
jgi:hypothetical protein